MKRFLSIAFLLCAFAGQCQNAFQKLCADYTSGYQKLEIPATSLDYQTNFENIKDTFAIGEQKQFFTEFSKKLSVFNNFNEQDKLRFAQLQYEVAMNLRRIELEMKWNREGRKIPEGGFYSMSHASEWYSYYIEYFTSVKISPPDVFAMGESEVKKVQNEINTLRSKLGYVSEDAFYKHLASDSFYITDKTIILKEYVAIDKKVRQGLNKLYPSKNISAIGFMQWPDATASTPPGMYQDKERSAYGKDVFLFNYYGQKHNRRAMQWLYMHEAIPGHHLQSTLRRNAKKISPLQNEFFYFGNAEGWACYVEDHGKEIGVYKDDYEYLGKWEWDLVRSARLVMEVGIHYYGWSYDKTMEYWKNNIEGQDAIADREIKRITNWAGQALCYKVGALTLEKIVAKKMLKGMTRKEANTFLLQNSDVPLQVLLDVG